MTDWYKLGSGKAPTPLPFSDFDAKGDNWTDLANNPDGRAACGYVEAPAQPDFDPATHLVRWDETEGAWIVEALPPPPPPGPEPVPETISDRQFAQALAKQGVITQDEALAFVKRGEVPAMLQAVIDGVADADERFDLDMAVSGATTFDRHNESTVVLAAALQWSPEQMDDLWRFAATIQ